MSQHQQAFLADTTGEVTRVARRVLSLLASGDLGVKDNDIILAPGAPSQNLIDLAERLYAASISPDRGRFADALSNVQRAEYSNDVLTFEMIPSIARRLGAAWEDDLISFADVTIGCTRLQSALRRLPDDIQNNAVAYNGVRQDCLVIVPAGAQHTMGAVILAKQLRQALQRVVVELEADAQKLGSLAHTQSFDIVLISASCGESPQVLRHLVDVARQHWAASKVVIGGSISNLESDSTNDIGADHVTQDWREALDLCI